MSTRAHIIVTDDVSTHYVYHHYDGYLEGVGKELKEYTKEYASLYSEGRLEPGADSFCIFLQGRDPNYEYEDTGLHGDEEYIYHVTFKDHSYIELSVNSIYHGGGSTRITDYKEEILLEKKNGDFADSMTDILSGIISEFFKSPSGKQVLRESINKFFNKE